MPMAGHASQMLSRERTYMYQTGPMSPLHTCSQGACRGEGSRLFSLWTVLGHPAWMQTPWWESRSTSLCQPRSDTQGCAGALRDDPVAAAGRVKARKRSAGRRAQARTGTEKVRRGLHGWEKQFNKVYKHGRERFRRTVGGQLFGSVLQVHLSTSAQNLRIKVLSCTLWFPKWG